MATITKPMALDESFNTTESTSRNQADVLAGIEEAIRQGFGQVASAVEYDHTDSGLTADNVQDAIDEVDDTVDGLVDDVTEISSDIESTQTVTGNPLTLTDAAPINAESLVVELEPKQDLHGYDHPWVGGAGKNKFNKEKSVNQRVTISGENITLTTMGQFQGSGAVPMPVNGSGTFVISGTIPSGCGVEVYFTDGNGTTTEPTIVLSASGEWFTIGNANTKLVEFLLGNRALGAGSYTFSYLQIEEGNTPTSFAPYSNICPITGYTECDVDDVGKNLFDEVYPDIDGNLRYKAINVGDGQFTLSTTTPRTNNEYAELFFLSGDVSSGASTADNGVWNGHSKTISSSNGYITIGYRTQYGNSPVNYNTQLEKGSTATPYEPYHSSNAPIQFGQTVYGGRSNFTEGGTDDEFESVDLGTFSWTYISSGNRFTSNDLMALIKAPASDSTLANILCSGLKPMSLNGLKNSAKDALIAIGDTGVISVRYTASGTDATAFKNAMDGIQLVYEKAIYDSISTPPTDLKLLQGANNLTTNGTTINLGYQPDNVIGEAIKASEEYTDRRFKEQPVSILFNVNDTPSEFAPLALDQVGHYYEIISDNLDKYRYFAAEIVDRMADRTQYVRCGCTGFLDYVVNSPKSVQFRLYVFDGIHANFAFYKDSETGKYMIHYRTDADGIPAFITLRIRMYN